MLPTSTSTPVKKPKHIRFQGEDNDEEVLYIFRKATITNMGWVFSTIILFLMPIMFGVFLQNLHIAYPQVISKSLIFEINMFWYIFSFGYGFERFLNWYFNVYIITNKRVVDMDFSHLLHRNISEAPLRNIEDVTYTVSGSLQTLFNFGSIKIQTAAEQRELEFEYISNPAKVQDILSDMVANIKGVYAK
ncbi:hypothetical protein A2V49_02340 [candidate division WWE3 bacterium RBG_19FT_COMBO_34_6]|uniref:YokE-like PH domain-containing protein n=1 Tax=candidate division WWE3 bacterium RBG_19FT_COMBO_34_6 TaxID=1802612 RepID=A0A1F4UKA2_UNCKA|nr:MAG: hypothetical protein A2V49_02340 [candidate division WWE3 bacterium RBG_19FT_COMBO_34_6]